MKNTKEDIDLKAFIEEAIANHFNIGNSRFIKPNEIHVTELSLCPIELTEILNNRSNETEELKFSELKYFHIGKLFHKNIEDIIDRQRNTKKEFNIQIEPKIRVPIYYTIPLNDPELTKVIRPPENFYLVGTPDIVINDSVFDLKTCSFLNYATENIPLRYYYQLNLYANMLNIKKAYLLFIEKSSFNMQQIEIPIEKDILSLTLRNITDTLNKKPIYHNPKECIVCRDEK